MLITVKFGCFFLKRFLFNTRIGSNVSEDVTASLTINRKDLDRISLGETSFKDLVDNGTIKITGDKNAFTNFLTKIDNFNF